MITKAISPFETMAIAADDHPANLLPDHKKAMLNALRQKNKDFTTGWYQVRSNDPQKIVCRIEKNEPYVTVEIRITEGTRIGEALFGYEVKKFIPKFRMCIDDTLREASFGLKYNTLINACPGIDLPWTTERPLSQEG